MASGAFVFWFMLALLDLITVFGVGTLLNMLTKQWWIALALYFLFSIYLIAVVGSHMVTPDWILFFIGWVGAALSAWAVISLKKHGYPLFS